MDYEFSKALEAGLSGEAVASDWLQQEGFLNGIDVNIVKADEFCKDYDLVVKGF